MLHLLERERRARTDAVGELADRFHEALFGQHLADQALHQRRLGIEGHAADQQLLRGRRPDQVGHATQALVSVSDAVAHRRLREGRLRRRDAQVAAGRDRNAAADAEAVDRRDGRLARVVERGQSALAGARVVLGAVFAHALLFVLRDIGTGDERLAAGARKHDHAHLGVGLDRSTASPMPCHISSEIALSLSGLLKTMWATAPSRRVRILSVIVRSLSGELGRPLLDKGVDGLAVVGGFMGERLERR